MVSVLWSVKVRIMLLNPIPPRIRFAITTSVKTRSPTTIISSVRIGDLRDEKYPVIVAIHEYAGLRELCRRTGTEVWKVTDSDYKKWIWLAAIVMNTRRKSTPVHLLDPSRYQQSYSRWERCPHRKFFCNDSMRPAQADRSASEPLIKLPTSLYFRYNRVFVGKCLLQVPLENIIACFKRWTNKAVIFVEDSASVSGLTKCCKINVSNILLYMIRREQMV